MPTHRQYIIGGTVPHEQTHKRTHHVFLAEVLVVLRETANPEDVVRSVGYDRVVVVYQRCVRVRHELLYRGCKHLELQVMISDNSHTVHLLIVKRLMIKVHKV